MMSAREAAWLRASALNYGPQKRNPSTRLLSRSGHLSRNWPNNEFKYEFVRDTFNGGEKRKVRKAIQDFEEEISSVYPPLKKCISFLEEDPSRPGRRVQLIGPLQAFSCSSNLGYNGGWVMRLGGPRCLRPETIKHELLHSLGIYHQQSRSDRDDNVEIMWKNINENNWHNFYKYDNAIVNSHDVPYDFMSVMHYHDKAMSNNTKVTIRTHDKNTQDVAGWNEDRGFTGGSGGPRLTDIELVRRMYKCDQLDLSKVNLPDGMPNKDLECKYFYGDDRTPTTRPSQVGFINTQPEHLAESWYNCKKLCFDNPECVEWTINYRTGTCTVGKSRLQKVPSKHLIVLYNQ